MKSVRKFLAVLLVSTVVISGWASTTSLATRPSHGSSIIYLADGLYDPPILPPPGGDTNSIPNTGV